MESPIDVASPRQVPEAGKRKLKVAQRKTASKQTPDEFETAERKLRAAKLKTQKWDHYIGFVTTKASGLAAAAGGITELVAPALLPIPEPITCLVIGAALLTGKSILGLIAKATSTDRS